MLKSEHLQYRLRGGQAYPRFAQPRQALPVAEQVLEVLKLHLHSRRAEIDEALQALEGDSPQYPLWRGLAHLALAEAEFKPVTTLDPVALRQQVFTRSAQRGYGEREAQGVLLELAQELEITPEELQEALYADLAENQRLTEVPPVSPQELLERYNLAQAQGLLYSAVRMVIHAYRNQVGEYKKLFRYLKFYRLMFAVEGDLDSGYRISVDGPASLFAQTRRYGIQMAALLPALLHVSKWEMTADLLLEGKTVQYALDSQVQLRSHYPRPPEFDSMLESSFAQRFARLDTPWRLEREVEVVDLRGTVFLPDFALRHPDGRLVHLEIVGFWHPEYLRRKLAKVRQARLDNLVLAVSQRLALGEEQLLDLPARVIWFKGQLRPEQVLAVLGDQSPE
jgi:predicted nuclease of restriction endonuclease-like RecB superfamily